MSKAAETRGVMVAVGSVATAFAFSMLAPEWMVRTAPFAPYVLAVIASSFVSARAPRLALALSLPLAWYTGVPPRGSFSVHDVRHVVGLAFFVAMAVAFILYSDALRRALRRAEEATRAREDFLSLAAHELRTPVTAAGLNVAALSRALAAGDVDRAKAAQVKLTDAHRRLGAVIEQLLDATRAMGDRLVLRPETVDLMALTRSVVEALADEAERSGVTLTVEGESSVGSWDPVLLGHAIANLVGNAVKYGRGAPVEVIVSAACVRVRDHGPGVAPEDRERIFERFERAASARNYGGFGLGLWLARKLAIANGGDIRLEDTPGGGATFVLTLSGA